jgi:hypothetical protein
MTPVLRQHAEIQFAHELDELQKADTRQRPTNWALSPWVVTDYLLGVRLETASRLRRNTSATAAWLEGFLGGGGMLQAHDEVLFQLLDQWVVGLSADHFIQVLPPAAAAPAADWDLGRAERLIPTLSLILGIDTD